MPYDRARVLAGQLVVSGGDVAHTGGGSVTPSDPLGAVLDVLRPSPTEFAGFVTGGTVGAYAGGPVGAVAGMFLGGMLAHFAERAIDRTTANGHAPKP